MQREGLAEFSVQGVIRSQRSLLASGFPPELSGAEVLATSQRWRRTMMSHLPPDLSSSESESYNCGRCLLWPVARCPHLTSVCTARAGVEDRAPCLGGPADTRDAKPTRVQIQCPTARAAHSWVITGEVEKLGSSPKLWIPSLGTQLTHLEGRNPPSQ